MLTSNHDPVSDTSNVETNGYQGSGTGRPSYEYSFNGQTRRMAITAGGNGFIVGANPTSVP
ncbi:hypothetical protein [Ruegeria atlantica]|uniref:hypothetical protein n=1 Tax=Ruegeria atlantica TaxID=81569 RepID=UPI00147A377C|nr:hypothetical protein [Ruegeria atlantica]